MALATRPQSRRPRPSRAGTGKGALQAGGDAGTPSQGSWPPRWLTPVPEEDIARGEGDLVADFISEHCRIHEDSWAGPKGDPINVRPWQREALRHIFARRPDGRRRHRVAIYSTARKNGKTSISAGVALYGLTMEGEGAQVIGCAADRDQAKLMFSAAKRMVELDPELSEEIRPYTNVLEHKASGSVYRAVSSEAYTKEGLSPTLVVGDEPHAWPTRELFDVMSLAMGARRDPLFLLPTTAGVMSTRTEDVSLLYGLFLYGQSLIRGEVEDPSFFMAWWSAITEEADHRDEKVWADANPGLGDLLDLEDLRSKIRITPEAEFRTKRLNLFVPTDSFWLPSGAWEGCQVGERSDDLLHGLDSRLPCAVGVDIAIVHDASAVAVAQVQGNKIMVRVRFWQNPHPRDTQAHQEWRMPLDEIVQYLRDLRTRFPVSAAKVDNVALPGPAYVYDKYGLASAELALERERGFSLIPIPQQGGWMIEASRRFYEAVLDGSISHDGDPTLASHLRNVVPRQVGESGWRLEKASKAKKIDGAVAVVMAVSQALEQPPVPQFRAFLA